MNLFTTPIEMLNLSPMLKNSLNRIGVKTFYDLLNTPQNDLENLENVGKKGLASIYAEINNKLHNEKAIKELEGFNINPKQSDLTLADVLALNFFNASLINNKPLVKDFQYLASCAYSVANEFLIARNNYFHAENIVTKGE